MILALAFPAGPVTILDVERAFVQKLGADRDDSGDHIYFYLQHGPSEFTVGKLSHSWRGALNDTQVMMLARKLYLHKREFQRFVDCELTRDQMIAIWSQRRPRFG